MKTMTKKITISDGPAPDDPGQRASDDIIRVLNSGLYINEKNMWLKTIYFLFEMCYYKNRKSIFTDEKLK